MKTKSAIGALAIILCNVCYAQGVKQFWINKGVFDEPKQIDENYYLSFDSAATHQVLRSKTPVSYDVFPLSIHYFNGKFYNTVMVSGEIFEYNPSTGENVLKNRIEGYNAGVVPNTLSMTIYNSVFYGLSSWSIEDNGESIPNGYIFKWDPVNNIYERLHGFQSETPMGKLVEHSGKLYGYALTEDRTGIIFEWDPAPGAVNPYMIKAAFPSEKEGNPTGSLLFLNGKFYGIACGNSGLAFYDNYSGEPGDAPHGILFEWDASDPVNGFQIKYTFPTPAEGIFPVGSLVEKDGKLYGMTFKGGTNDRGVLFEWNPEGSGTYTKMQDINDLPNGSPSTKRELTKMGDNIYALLTEHPHSYLFKWNPTLNNLSYGNLLDDYDVTDFVVVPALISLPAPGDCENFPTVTVNNINNNSWVPITDSKGDVLAEIQPHDNDLGLLDVHAYINEGAVRTDGQGKPYLDRNITITPATQPAEGNPVDIRLYITKAEFEALKAAPNSGINDISDLAIFKSSEACSGTVTEAIPMATTYEDYEFGYVLKASVTSFSTFYFSNRLFESLPLQLLNFSGTLQSDDLVLLWKTDNEHNTHSFDIDRSIDGIHFSAIGNVAASNTAGKHQYYFTDKEVTELSASVVYYRLSQKDIDGKAVYSKIISINLPSARLVTISPNPAGNYINVKLRKQLNTANTLIQITDMGGRKVMEQKINTATNTHKINLMTLSKGVYMITVIHNGERMTSKFVKQ